MNQLGLYLDDFRIPKAKPAEIKKWIIVRNYEEFKERIENNPLPYLVSFDHDLADEHYAPEVPGYEYKEKTGLDCARFLLEYCQGKKERLPLVVVHSANPVGSQRIIDLLQPYQKEIIRRIPW